MSEVQVPIQFTDAAANKVLAPWSPKRKTLS